MLIIEILFLITFIKFSLSLETFCKNEKNETVDWYVLYKLPADHKSENDLIKSGSAYMFITSDDYGTDWKFSNISITSSNSMPALTLQKFYKNETEMHVFYNDETPSGNVNDVLGHTKGVLLGDLRDGLWLIHSVPKFPPDDKYSYPESALTYGQSFLCISLVITDMNGIGHQLQYNEANVYSSFISEGFTQYAKNLIDLINKKYVSDAPWYSLLRFISRMGIRFTSYAKSRHFGKDLYADLIAPALKNDMLVESWLNGRGKLPSNCNNIYKVFNIEELRPIGNATFSSSKDHSKWAINSKSLSYFVCIGDINREEHQKNRGGGAVCIFRDNLWHAFNTLIVKSESCN